MFIVSGVTDQPIDVSVCPINSSIVSLSDRNLSDMSFLSNLIVPDNSVVGEITHKGNIFIQTIHISLKY